MKKLKLFIVFFSLIFTSLCFAQSGWFWQNPLPQGNNLNDITILDNGVCYAVGVAGTVIKSTDYGLNWTFIHSDSGRAFNSVQFYNEFTGWVASSVFNGTGDCKVLKTTNGGHTWVTKILDWNSFNYSLDFTSLDTGYYTMKNGNVNGYIYKTTDAGENWSSIFSINGFYVSNTQFLDNLNGYACGSLGIFKTSNGGMNWQNQFQFSGMGGYFSSISFMNNNTGFAVGVRNSYPYSYQIVMRTTNSGLNWLELTTGTSNSLADIKVVGDNSIYICGYNVLLKSTNLGINWAAIPLNSSNVDLKSMDFNSSKGLVTGSFGIILRSTNYGINWINNYFSYRDYNTVTRIRFHNKDIGYATSGTNVYKTTNAGVNWLLFNTQSPTQLLALFVVDSNIVYAGGGSTAENCPVVKTTNGGLNWVLQNPNAGNGYLHDLFFLNKDTGYCSSSRYVCKTTNGGLNWLQTTFDYDNFNSISFVNNNTGFVIGFYQSFKTTNAGTNWLQIPVNGQEGYFLNPDTGYVCGLGMKVQKSTNGGLNWFTQTQSNGSWRFYGIRFFNSYLGYAVGDFGAIAKTTNGGNTWTYQNSHTNNRLASVFITDTNAVYVSGDGSTILKSTNGGNPIGISSISQNVTDNYLLKQNYPNPFNPQTKIKFDIPSNVKGQTSNVKLIIYDLLGREVTTLVNEELKPGTYEADWDGSNYSSGVYFYKIITEGFVETKKMVLMK